MNNLFSPPFGTELLTKRRKIRRELLEQREQFIDKKIAILGGSTTNDVREILDLFLLHYGIHATYYESEYNQYWQDAMFPNEELERFEPDIIFIHTSNYNIHNWPRLSDSVEIVDELLDECYGRFSEMWERLEKVYGCPIIQNNFDYPLWRLQGNREASDIHGRINFITRLNLRFAEYAQTNKSFFINDINYLSARYGLDEWSNPFYWHMYKCAVALPAIPYLAQSVANIIKAIYGMNKKAFVLDLDNTLWGGIVGDDGVDNLEIGQETSVGQAYREFQTYIKDHKDMGILINVCSKNEEENAVAGLNHPEGVLKPEDFIVIKANWVPKSQNVLQISQELNLGLDSLVFVDDNPAEREIIRQQLNMVAVPEVSTVENYIYEIDRHGYFEAVSLSKEDLERNQMYKANIERARNASSFQNYVDYLTSLNMHAVIKPFEAVYMARIAQLTNKSNQFNLTTKRYSQTEIEEVASDKTWLTLYGKLEDRFGDNGVVSVIIGRLDEKVCHIELWLMSCRVLKRGMESAMMDTLVHRLKECGIKEIRGYYYPTAKNAMVKNFYEEQGFTRISCDEDGKTEWQFIIEEDYINSNQVIEVEE